jgi:hypothetical protein
MDWKTATLASCLAALVTLGCGGSSNSTPPPTTTDFTGTFVANDGTNGVLNLTFAGTVSAALTADSTSVAATTSTVNVTGTLTLGSQTIPLTGTYDPTTHSFTVSGGGYTLNGQITTSGIVGTFTGPSNSGNFTALAGSSTTVTVYCGTYTGSSVGGTWNIVQNGTTLNGVASGNPSVTLTGTVSGNSMSITWVTGSASGTISGTTVSGTWQDPRHSGTFTGTKC